MSDRPTRPAQRKGPAAIRVNDSDHQRVSVGGPSRDIHAVATQLGLTRADPPLLRSGPTSALPELIGVGSSPLNPAHAHVRVKPHLFTSVLERGRLAPAL